MGLALMVNRLPVLATAPARPPRARLDQADVQPFETGLVELARVHHPNVSWWHGYRRAEERFGSYCYVCERFVVTWGGNGSPPAAAREEIDQHKWLHKRGTIPAPRKQTRKAP